MHINVKICGIRSVESAVAAFDAGAEFIGLNFVPHSKRRVSLETAKEIVNAVKGQVKVVGIFQDAEAAHVNDVAKRLKLDFVQLHGQEDPAFCAQINHDIIKAVRLKHDANAQEVIASLKQYNVPFVLLDREKQGEGDPVTAEIAKQIAAEMRVFLAGGLTPDNVAEMIQRVRPFGVDVAGGIETGGNEDNEKIKRFIENAKSVAI